MQECLQQEDARRWYKIFKNIGQKLLKYQILLGQALGPAQGRACEKALRGADLHENLLFMEKRTNIWDFRQLVVERG